MKRTIPTLVIAMLAFGAQDAWSQDKRRDHRKRPAPAAAPEVKSTSPQSGTPGTRVTVKGKNLPADAKIRFGREEIAPDRARPGSIRFTVPDVKSGNHRVVIRHAGGELSLGRFAVTEPPVEEPVRSRRDRRRGADEPEPVEEPVRSRRDHRRGADEPPAEEPVRSRRDRRRDFRNRVVVSSFGPSSGPSGTSVTIRGRNFEGDAVVTLGGEMIKPKRVRPTSITFEIPRRSKSGLLAVRQAGQRRDAVVGNFEVLAKRRSAADRKKLRQVRHQRAKKRYAERRKSMPSKKEERRRAYEERQRELEQSRLERRRQRQAAIRARFEQAFLADGQVQAELALHAERKARLNRMLFLAEMDDHERLAIRIEVLIDREDERHERRMELLKTTFRN